MVESDWDEEGDCHVTRPQSLNQPNFKQYNNDRHSPKKRQFTERTEYPRRDKISQDSDQITKTIDIDSSYVGRIIGKGGSRINELKFQTNTHISVIDRISENGLSSIVIKGEAKGIEEAVLRIKELTTEKQSYDRPQQFNRSSRNTNIKGTIDWNALHKNTEIRNQERFGNLVEIVKIFYHEPKHINNLTDEEVQKIREDKHKISVKDLSDQEQRNIPRPILSFEDIFEKYAEIMSSVTVAGFKEPSPIQCQAWPIIMSGYDLIGIAQTGTGKTLAFLLPALIHIDSQPTPRKERQGPTCLILSPTRELAQQIHQEVGKFNYKQIRSVCIYGGGSRREQINTVERGVEIVIATPGRLNDLISNNIISLTSVTYLVLDEADRMLDLGFEPEIRKVLLDIRPDRQTIMTSATWPPGVTRLIRSYMTYPMQINVGSLNLTACKNVTQKIEFIEYDDKLDRIKRFIDDMPNDCKVLIFVARKITADHLTSDLVLCNSCDGAIQCIHGNREQIDREQAISDFKSGEARVLIATDVASRGLDIADINFVVNYDFPKNIEEYVHRIGRTGRAGKFGVSLSFISRENWASAQPLIDILKDSNQHIPDELILMAERFSEKQRQREQEKGTGKSSLFSSHISMNTTSMMGMGTKLCRQCGKPGHLSRSCPQNN